MVCIVIYRSFICALCYENQKRDFYGFVAHQLPLLKRTQFYLFNNWVIVGMLGYVLFYNLNYYLANPFSIFRIWDGGMAFHGGFIGVILAVMIFAVPTQFHCGVLLI